MGFMYDNQSSLALTSSCVVNFVAVFQLFQKVSRSLNSMFQNEQTDGNTVHLRDVTT
jgi:hypothetical protein